MAATTLKIGSQIFLFCQKGTHARRLVITAHGATKGHFDTPKQLIFYSDPGDEMIDQTIAMITREGSESNGHVRAGTKKTDDYHLTTYQTKQGHGPETHEDLLDEVRRLSEGGENDLWDIVAVREPMRLSGVLDELARRQPERFAAYDEVHCSFCRV